MDPLYGMAMRLTRDEQRAEDLVQEAALKAYRAFHRFEPGTNFRAWIFRIMTNTFITGYHRRKREASSAVDLESRSHYQRFVGLGSTRPARDPESEVLDRMMSEDITAALEQLPEEFRQVVLLCDVEGFAYKEIAEILGCPVGTVMSRLYRGRRMLQNLLYTHAVEQGIIDPPPEEDVGKGAEGGQSSNWRKNSAQKAVNSGSAPHCDSDSDSGPGARKDEDNGVARLDDYRSRKKGQES